MGIEACNREARVDAAEILGQRVKHHRARCNDRVRIEVPKNFPQRRVDGEGHHAERRGDIRRCKHHDPPPPPPQRGPIFGVAGENQTRPPPPPLFKCPPAPPPPPSPPAT